MDDILVPIIIAPTLFICTTVVLSVMLKYYFKKRKLLSAEILAAIEKGADVPLPAPMSRNYLNLGIIWSLVGVAFTIAIWVSSESVEGAVWGLLPFALGIAFLLIHKFQKDEES